MDEESMNTNLSQQSMIEYLRENADELSIYTVSNMLMSIGNSERIKEILMDETIPLTPWHKEAVIRRLGDKDFTEKCLRGEVNGIQLEPFSKTRLWLSKEWIDSKDKDHDIQEFIKKPLFELDSECLTELIFSLSEPEKRRPYALDTNVPINWLTRVNIASELGDINLIKEIVGQMQITEKTKVAEIDDICDAVGIIKDIDIRKNFLRSNHSKIHVAGIDTILEGSSYDGVEPIPSPIEFLKEIGLNVRKIDNIIEYGNTALTPEEKDGWNKGVRIIRNVSGLGIEELDNDSSIKVIKILDEDNHSMPSEIYDAGTYAKILKVLNKITKGIEPAKEGDIESQVNAFSKVFSRLSRIEYDYYAISEEGEKDKELQIATRNLEGGLLNGKCVCLGYSRILKNALSLVNIDSLVISGSHEDIMHEGHAWNQVKIGENWFNCDLTNSREHGMFWGGKHAYRALKSDKEFAQNDVYSFHRSKEEHACPNSIDETIGKKTFGSYVRKWAERLGISKINETTRAIQALENIPLVSLEMNPNANNQAINEYEARQ